MSMGLLCDVALGCWPQDGVGRKELGERGMVSAACCSDRVVLGRESSLDLSEPQLPAV